MCGVRQRPKKTTPTHNPGEIEARSRPHHSQRARPRRAASRHARATYAATRTATRTNATSTHPQPILRTLRAGMCSVMVESRVAAPSDMLTIRDALVAVVSAAATLLASHAVHAHGAHLTTLGRAKASGELAFVLSVGLQFRDNASAQSLLKAWEKAAQYCIANEPFLYAYEVAQSDQDPLRYVIFERYRSKEDYTGAHRRSPAFKAFRPQMRELQDSGAVTVTGSSYRELGLGFT